MMLGFAGTPDFAARALEALLAAAGTAEEALAMLEKIDLPPQARQQAEQAKQQLDSLSGQAAMKNAQTKAQVASAGQQQTPGVFQPINLQQPQGQ